MKYVLWSPTHIEVREAITKSDGEIIPAKEFVVSERALYAHRRFANRRYRNDYPPRSPMLKLMTYNNIEDARQEQSELYEYCGEMFEIHEYNKGRIGKIIE